MVEQKSPSSKPHGTDRLSFWRVTLSVLQASFGVQNRSNRERDFGQKSILPYVAAALIFTFLLVLTLLLVVRLVS